MQVLEDASLHQAAGALQGVLTTAKGAGPDAAAAAQCPQQQQQQLLLLL